MASAFTPSTSTESHTPLPGQPLDSSNRSIVMQNNHIAQGVTINIFSSNCNGSTVSKLEHVAAQPAEPTSLQRPLGKQLAPVEYCHGSIVFNGNTFGDFVSVNIASSDNTGAVKQTVLQSQTKHI